MIDKKKGLGISLTDAISHINEMPSNAVDLQRKFPIELLPIWLQKTIKEHADSYGTPEELWAIAFLCGIAAATGKRIKIVSGNYKNYPQLWVMVVGSSGTGKSDAFRVAFRRLSDIDSERHAKFDSDYRDWEAQEKQGTPPQWEQTIIGDTTPEALFNVLSQAETGLTLYRDELSGWFSDFGRYAKSGEAGHYLSIFDNQPFSINRKKDRPQLLTEPSLNIFGTIQPSVLSELLGKNNFEQSGFAPRFLFLYPEFPIRRYKRTTTTPSTEFYDKIIDKIVGFHGVDVMYLSDEAENEYEDFYNEMEEERSRSNDFWASVYSKAQIQVLRLALTVKIAHLVDEPDNNVSEMDMRAGIGMMRYFINSLKKFKGAQRILSDTKRDLIIQMFCQNPTFNQTRVAQELGVSREYVNRVVRSLLTDHNDTKPFAVYDYRGNRV
jgi:hypothetical protein